MISVWHRLIPSAWLVVLLCSAALGQAADTGDHWAFRPVKRPEAPGPGLPIDAFIPGCPPKPEAMIAGIVTVIGALRDGSIVPKCMDVEALSPDAVPDLTSEARP